MRLDALGLPSRSSKDCEKLVHLGKLFASVGKEVLEVELGKQRTTAKACPVAGAIRSLVSSLFANGLRLRPLRHDLSIGLRSSGAGPQHAMQSRALRASPAPGTCPPERGATGSTWKWARRPAPAADAGSPFPVGLAMGVGLRGWLSQRQVRDWTWARSGLFTAGADGSHDPLCCDRARSGLRRPIGTLDSTTHRRRPGRDGVDTEGRSSTGVAADGVANSTPDKGAGTIKERQVSTATPSPPGGPVRFAHGPPRGATC